jgi:hypothetical protein
VYIMKLNMGIATTQDNNIMYFVLNEHLFKNLVSDLQLQLTNKNK